MTRTLTFSGRSEWTPDVHIGPGGQVESHLFIKSISKCDLTFMPFCKSFQKAFVIKSDSMLGSKKTIAVVKGTHSLVD